LNDWEYGLDVVVGSSMHTYMYSEHNIDIRRLL